MHRGLKGQWLPESREDALKLFELHDMSFKVCFECGQALHLPEAASTAAGWRETQISGICEPCFDEMFDEGEGNG